jgi:fumarate reductase subunit C
MDDSGESVHDESIMLKIGDTVTFTWRDGVLEGKGVVDDFIGLSCPCSQYADCVFQIGVRSRVAASLEFAEFVKMNPESVRAKSEHLIEHYNALQRRQEKEAAMNARLFENRVGCPAYFGEAIQLLHLSSGKCLSVSREETAKTEPENFKLYLSSVVRQNSWFKLSCAAAAMHTEGDLIGNLSDVILSPVMFPEEAVHVSAAPMAKKEHRRRSIATVRAGTPQACAEVNSSFHVGPTGGAPEIHEVNASFESSPLRVILFAEWQKKGCLTCGDFVYVEDAEGKSCLRPLSSAEQAAVSHDSADDEAVLQSMHGAIVFAPADDDSSAIWVVERPQKSIGGPLSWNQNYTLRHLKTGRFLTGGGKSLTLTNQAPPFGTTAGAAPVPPHLRFLPASASTLRKTGDEKYMHDRCCTIIESGDRFAFKDDGHTAYLSGRRFVCSGQTGERDGGSAVVLRKVMPEGNQQPVLFGLNARKPLMALASDLQRGGAPAGGNPTMSLANELQLGGAPASGTFDCEASSLIVQQLCRFVVLDDIEDPKFPTKLSHLIQVVTKRQHMLHQQDCVGLVIDILQQQRKLALDGAHPEAVAGERRRHPEADRTSWSMLTSKALLLLRLVLIRNPANQVAVSERISVLLSYIGTKHSDQAVLCLAELFGNRQVQESIGLGEVEAFVGMLRTTPLNATALGVMERLCECNGVAVESNQQLLIDHVLDSASPTAGTAVVTTAAGRARASARAIAVGGINEQVLVRITPLPNGTFQFLFPGEGTRRTLAECDKNRTLFLTAQLNLLAALCHSRMYIAIDLLKPALPFRHVEAQLGKMASAERPSVELRSALVRLVTVLYVDCAPQAVKIGTGRCFVWSGVVAPESMRLPSPTEATKAKELRSLQGVITEELELVQMNTLTTNVLNLQTKLLDFHFYNDNFAMLQGAVGALVKAISAQAMSSDAECEDAEKNVLKQLGMCSIVASKLKGALSFERKSVLRLLDSIPAMLFILGLVFAAITVMLYQGDSTHDGYVTFEYMTFFIFLVELTTRMIAVNNTKTFFSDPFGVIDFLVVLLDAMMLLNILSFLGGETKALRAIRMLRLVRAFRMVKLAIKIREEMRRPKPTVPWVLNERFVHSSLAKLVGLTRMLDVLLRIDAILGEHRFAKLLASLKQVHASATSRSSGLVLHGGKVAPTGGTTMPIKQVVAHVVNNHGISLNVGGTGTADVTDMLLGMILYEWPPLVQSSIQLLMSHHESTGQMVESMQRFQLLSGDEDEQLYAVLKAEITEVWNLIETNELWRGMATPKDVDTGLRVVEILAHFRAVIIEPDPLWIGGGLENRAREKAQVLLRNLGAFELCMLVREAVPKLAIFDAKVTITADTSDSVVVARGIHLMNNDFLCWWMHRNAENQALAFQQLATFEDDIMSNIGSTAVIMEMVRDNPELIKLVPQSLFDKLTRWFELQSEAEADPASVELLRLLVLCRDVVLGENQFRVFKLLMIQGVKKRLFICSDANEPDFRERARLMALARTELETEPINCPALADSFVQAKVAGGSDAGLAALRAGSSARIGVNTTYFYMPRKLQFHVQVLKLMATCAAGKRHIIEAKVQALLASGSSSSPAPAPPRASHHSTSHALAQPAALISPPPRARPSRLHCSPLSSIRFPFALSSLLSPLSSFRFPLV